MANKKYSDEEQALRDSLLGSVYDKQNFTTEELQNYTDIVNKAQSGETTWKDANNYAEQIRKQYGYSGGSDGHGYNAIQTTGTSYNVPTYEELPAYTNQYSDQINELAEQILNRGNFEYDYSTDPQYQAYKKEYTREGQRATADALGQYAAATGGMPSTAAMTAATQAGDYYSAQLADKIPELYQLAYSMWQSEGDDLMNNLSMLQSLEQNDYAKYLDQLSQYNTNRDYNYNVSNADRNYDYQVSRDAVEDERYDNETAYTVKQDEEAAALEKAQILANYGDFSGFEALGYTPEQIANMTSYQNSQKSSSSTGSTSNEWYDKALKKAEEYESAKEAMSYLESLVDGGKLSPDEAVDIYYYELGYAEPDVELKKTLSKLNGSKGSLGGTTNNLKQNLKSTR